jgi:hypothetical protein
MDVVAGEAGDAVLAGVDSMQIFAAVPKVGGWEFDFASTRLRSWHSKQSRGMSTFNRWRKRAVCGE